MPTPITASTLSALLSAALAQKPTRPLVLALDGRCGSGKTTLANGLAAQFPDCTLLRTDDFYLPPARRCPDWAHTPCANMDLTRLRDEALRPAYAGQTVDYRAYSCREGAYLPPAQLPAQPLVILEGSYSHHPLLRPYETLRGLPVSHCLVPLFTLRCIFTALDVLECSLIRSYEATTGTHLDREVAEGETTFH